MALELRLLSALRTRADILIDTSALGPHDLRAEIMRLFGPQDGTAMGVQVESFSYKRGIPRGVDFVFDCRFLNNPHWQPELRKLDGRDPRVAQFIASDPRHDPFFQRLQSMAESVLPKFALQGKPLVTIALGCTGGQHRSVAMAEITAAHLAESGWRVSKRHREMDLRSAARGSDGTPTSEA